MSRKYTLVHEGLSQWIKSPNNGGECCQTCVDTVDELNRLLACIKLLEEAGDAIVGFNIGCGCGENGLCRGCQNAVEAWHNAKEAKL